MKEFWNFTEPGAATRRGFCKMSAAICPTTKSTSSPRPVPANDPRHRTDQTPECEHAHFGTLHHDSGTVGSKDSGSLFMRRIRTGGLRLPEPEAAEGHYGRNLSGASQCNDPFLRHGNARRGYRPDRQRRSRLF